MSAGFLGRAAVACALCYVAAILILHLLQPGLNPSQVHVSHFVHGRGGFLLTVGAFLFALGLAALAAGLRRSLWGIRGKSHRAGIFFLWMAAVGWAGGAVFPVSLVTPPTTASGWLHVASGLVALASVGVGFLLVSMALRHDRRWRPIFGYALGLTILFLAGFALMLFEFDGGASGPGILQRVALGTAALWMILVGHRLAKLKPESPGDSR